MPRRRRRYKNTPRAEDLEAVSGRWKVLEVVYEGNPDSIDEDLGQVDISGPGFQGVEVVMDEQCDVVWHIPRGVEPISLFQTTSFCIDRDSIDFMGGPDGKQFTFEVTGDQDVLQLSSDSEELGGTMTIRITKVRQPQEASLSPFSLREALEQGFFSDLSLRSADGQTFPAHRTVLMSCCPGMGYRDWEIFLSGLKASALRAALHCIYTNSFPVDLTIPQAKELLTATSANPKLTSLTELCRVFIESHNLKLKLIQLMDDILAGFEVGRKIVESTEMHNPARVAYAVKQLVKEAAVVVSKFFLLCELYTRNKKEMSKPERQEVLEYCRGRVVVFIDQARELLELILEKWDSLTDIQKQETAQYIIPEVRHVWDLVLEVTKDIQGVISRVSHESSQGRKTFGRLERHELKVTLALQFMSRGKEVRRLEKIGKEFNDFVLVATKKREEFNDWDENEKSERILRAIAHLITEGVSTLEQLEEAKKEILMENALEWKKFKLLVAIMCSYTSWGLRKLLSLKEPLKPVLLRGCRFVKRNEVNQALLFFGLLEQADVVAMETEEGAGSREGEAVAGTMPGLQCPLLQENQLAQGCYRLLESHDLSDMQFIIEPRPPPEVCATPPNQPEGGGATSHDQPEGCRVVIPAHRVIVASRCEWFCRALQSGMKEAIDRRIVICDAEEGVFRTFLKFLYGGPLDTSAMTVEELVELLAVADRYETPSLRSLCESLLVGRVEDSTVFLLLTIADRYSVRKLRESTLQHILSSPEVVVMDVEGWTGLPSDLQQEIRTLLAATSDPHLLLRHQLPPTPLSSSPPPSQPPTSTPPEQPTARSSSEGSSGGEYGLHDDTLSFQRALSELKGVVGVEAPEELLRDLLLAADCDVNRALNYYFNTQGDS